MTCIVYDPNYNMSLMGMEKLHPFDVRKFGRAWSALEDRLGARLAGWHLPVDRPVEREELLAVHTARYLDEDVRSSTALARIFEQPIVATIPIGFIDRGVLAPMRWATRGSVLGARAALEQGLAINLGGGFHHAKPDKGEGFCVYSDIALAVHDLRAGSLISGTDQIAYVDLDAHQGNGVCHQFLNDRLVRIFDEYNGDIYPISDTVARERIDCDVPLGIGCDGDEYLLLLQRRLPEFLDRVVECGDVGIAIYNAGTDVYRFDDFGMLALGELNVLERDLFVVGELRKRNLPTLFLTSGGYSLDSYALIAASVAALLDRFG
jgi:histone deacetylase 11